MRGKRLIVILLTGISILIFTGCAKTSKEEQEKAKAYVNQYREQVTEYIKEAYGKSSKITDMNAWLVTSHPGVLPGAGVNHANGWVVANVKAKDEKFRVVYNPEANEYLTDKNKAKIEQSFREYIANVLGEDKILFLKMQYGKSDEVYYSSTYFTDMKYINFDQLFDNRHRILIECYLESTDLNQLKETGALKELENLVLKGCYPMGETGVFLVNIEDKSNLEEREWNKIRYQSCYDNFNNFKTAVINGKEYYVRTSDYTIKHPNNTFGIWYGANSPLAVHDDNGELISVVY